jgi:hypothetical protein
MVIAWLALLSLPGAAQASVTAAAADGGRPLNAAALGTTVAWSSYSRRAGGYRLRVQSGRRRPMTLPLRTRRVPFDVDIGRRRPLWTRSRYPPARRL